MLLKYKPYWRKTGLKGKWGDIYLEHLNRYKPKFFLELGVFCGVTARNTCDYLFKIHGKNFSYIGVDLFSKKSEINEEEIAPDFLRKQKFSNPFKNIYYNLIMRENLNSLESNKKFLNKYRENILLLAGDSNKVLKDLDLKKIDYAFIDGGHSYNTVTNDLEMLYKNLKGKKKILLCDDYGSSSYIKEVKKAIDDFVSLHKLSLNVIENRFAEIIT